MINGQRRITELLMHARREARKLPSLETQLERRKAHLFQSRRAQWELG